MLLRIESERLKTKLEERKGFVGFGAKATSVVAVVEGLFLILAAVTAPVAMWWRIAFTTAGTLVTAYAVISAIITWKHGYDANRLYEELITMDRTTKRSSIIAVTDGNRYLLYRDVNWGCDFFPNHATASSETENLRILSEYLSTGFDIPRDDFTLNRITGESHEKYSTEHNETRYYDYTLYSATINHMPPAWKHERFHVDSKDCTWMTTDEMLNDPTISRINPDVVDMVRRNL